MNTASIILAAGASSRLGVPKQQLLFKGQSLLQHAIAAAIIARCTPVLVITGANHTLIKTEINEPEVQLIYNQHWQQGMSSSLQCGLQYLLQQVPNVQQVLLQLCDQPFVNGFLLQQIITAQQVSKKNIVACGYNNTVGPPVLFTQTYFSDLLNLSGQEGAKKVILNHEDDVTVIPFVKGAIDIDTQADYLNLLKEANL